jgi:hypothetical protein
MKKIIIVDEDTYRKLEDAKGYKDWDTYIKEIMDINIKLDKIEDTLLTIDVCTFNIGTKIGLDQV